MLPGGKIPGVKGSASRREDLDKFGHQMDNSGLMCRDAIRGVAHIGGMSIAVCPVQRLSFDRQGSCLFIVCLLNLESIGSL